MMIFNLVFLFVLYVIGAILIVKNADLISHVFWISAIIVTLWFGCGTIIACQ